MPILVVNAGSTTIKFKLFDHKHTFLMGGIIDKKAEGVEFKLNKDGKEYEWEITEADFNNKAAELILKECEGFTIDQMGYRVVHGGELFTAPTVLTDEVVTSLEGLTNLAPLHNPPALNTIRQFKTLLPNVKHTAVFDTAFHSSIPEKSYRYAIPSNFYRNQKIRRYGFHGTSHEYVTSRMAELEPLAKKIISCHLGGGASISAIDDGRSLDNSMGFTPLEGLVMATRSGDLDSGAVLYMIEEAGVAPSVIREILNKHSGLLALSERTSDMRELLKLSDEGDKKARLAIEAYIYRIQKYIGAYAAALGGVDALVFTAGVGYGSGIIRSMICSNLGFLGFELDSQANVTNATTSEFEISSSASKPVWVIEANEELAIVKQISN